MNMKEKLKLTTLINKSATRPNGAQLADCLRECELHFGFPNMMPFSQEKEVITYTFSTDNQDIFNELQYYKERLGELCIELLEINYELPFDEDNNPLVTIRLVPQISKLPVEPENHFSDIEKSILVEINSAQHSIFAAVAWINNLKIINAIQKKANEGVAVFLIVDDCIKNRRFFSTPTNFPICFANNLSGHFALMHEKFCIIDNRVVIHGSYNWTNNAEYCNDEHITIDNNNSSTASFLDEFKRLRKDYNCFFTYNATNV